MKKYIENTPEYFCANLITVSRGVTSLAAAMLTMSNHPVPAILMLGLGIASDCYDGYYARKHEVSSRQGEAYDIAADGTLVLASILWITKYVLGKTIGPDFGSIPLGNESIQVLDTFIHLLIIPLVASFYGRWSFDTIRLKVDN